VLYALAAVFGALGVMTIRPGDWPAPQGVVEFVIALALIGAMALWVRANRLALTPGAARGTTRVVRLSSTTVGDRSRRSTMNDLLYIGIAVIFFVASWGLVWLCDRV
jgi:hypothetical protein